MDNLKKASGFIPLTLIVMMTVAAVIFPLHAKAQKFTVGSFSELPNDISAFISPVKDRNDEDCALLKVEATSPDFAFSTPLGIVKRIDKTGEIWLYLPRGSKKITIKHPDWGVMRDYVFPSRLESNRSYEIDITEPIQPKASAESGPIITTVTDTLLLTRVDTIVINSVSPKIPLETDLLASIAYGARAHYLTWGIMAAVMKRHGAFLHIATDFGKTGYLDGTCDKAGNIDGIMRYYSGQTRRKAYIMSAGAIHRAGSHVSIFEGLGYSSCTLAWQLAESEGGGYVKNSYFSTSGITAEAGVMIKINRLSVSVSAITIKGKEWFVSAGIGIRIGNNIK